MDGKNGFFIIRTIIAIHFTTHKVRQLLLVKIFVKNKTNLTRNSQKHILLRTAHIIRILLFLCKQLFKSC